MFAEAVWINCSNGLVMPLEFAFAEYPNQLKLYRVAPLPDYYWMTLRDLNNTKARMGNTDRFYNSKATNYHLEIPSWIEWRLDADKWLSQLHTSVPLDTPLIVRGHSQYMFFKNICGYWNVQIIKLMTGVGVVQNFHHHNVCKSWDYPCPGIEVNTMVNNSMKM